jgi:hypothetical protein
MFTVDAYRGPAPFEILATIRRMSPVALRLFPNMEPLAMRAKVGFNVLAFNVSVIDCARLEGRNFEIAKSLLALALCAIKTNHVLPKNRISFAAENGRAADESLSQARQSCLLKGRRRVRELCFPSGVSRPRTPWPAARPEGSA